MEEKGTKAYGGPDFKTFFSAYKVPIGIEIEVEGFKVGAWPKTIYWRLETDGSLRNNGREIISVPVAGKNIDFALAELEKAMEGQHPAWSHRCSVHVHINVRNWTFEEARALVAAYAVFENLFFSLVPEDRKANGFAYPLTDISPEEVRLGSVDGKYCALNIGTGVRNYGTYEFRQHHGTANRTTLRRWIQLIVKLHNYVRKEGYQKITQLISTLNTTSEYHQLLREVFGQTAAVFPPVVLQKSMEDGVLWAKVYLGSNQ
jgi:hypothetical protein